jgi:hypothetical protein
MFRSLQSDGITRIRRLFAFRTVDCTFNFYYYYHIIFIIHLFIYMFRSPQSDEISRSGVCLLTGLSTVMAGRIPVLKVISRIIRVQNLPVAASSLQSPSSQMQHLYSQNSMSGTVISVEESISGRFSVHFNTFQRQNV